MRRMTTLFAATLLLCGSVARATVTSAWTYEPSGPSQALFADSTLGILYDVSADELQAITWDNMKVNWTKPSPCPGKHLPASVMALASDTLLLECSNLVYKMLERASGSTFAAHKFSYVEEEVPGVSNTVGTVCGVDWCMFANGTFWSLPMAATGVSYYQENFMYNETFGVGHVVQPAASSGSGALTVGDFEIRSAATGNLLQRVSWAEMGAAWGPDFLIQAGRYVVMVNQTGYSSSGIGVAEGMELVDLATGQSTPHRVSLLEYETYNAHPYVPGRPTPSTGTVLASAPEGDDSVYVVSAFLNGNARRDDAPLTLIAWKVPVAAALGGSITSIPRLWTTNVSFDFPSPSSAEGEGVLCSIFGTNVVCAVQTGLGVTQVVTVDVLTGNAFTTTTGMFAYGPSLYSAVEGSALLSTYSGNLTAVSFSGSGVQWQKPNSMVVPFPEQPQVAAGAGCVIVQSLFAGIPNTQSASWGFDCIKWW